MLRAIALKVRRLSLTPQATDQNAYDSIRGYPRDAETLPNCGAGEPDRII